MRIACLLLAFFPLPLACGGSVANIDGGPGDAGSDGTTPSDAAPSDGSPAPDSGPGGPCPGSPPTASAPCSDDGLECEYGSNPSPSCNQLFLCSNGAWTDETAKQVCPPQSDCPSSYASVPQNQTCSPENLACEYTEGTCICSHGAPVSQTPTWHCFPTQSGCPSPRPNIGDTCNAPSSLSCNYGACNGGVELQCKGGVWQQVEVPCPG